MKEQNRVSVRKSVRQLTPAETELINGGFYTTTAPTPSSPVNPFILCQPGFVFRCTKHGCFCVAA